MWISGCFIWNFLVIFFPKEMTQSNSKHQGEKMRSVLKYNMLKLIHLHNMMDYNLLWKSLKCKWNAFLKKNPTQKWTRWSQRYATFFPWGNCFGDTWPNYIIEFSMIFYKLLIWKWFNKFVWRVACDLLVFLWSPKHVL